MQEDSGKDVAELLRQGQAAAEKQDWQQARLLFEAVLRIDPQNAEALNDLGVVAFHVSQWRQAESYWKRALAVPNPSQDALHNLTCLQDLQEAQLRVASVDGGSAPAGKRRESSGGELLEKGRRQRRPRVGFVSLWFERGQAYITQALRRALEPAFETFVLARNGSSDGRRVMQTTGEWDVPNLTTTPRYEIDPKFFAEWVGSNRLEVVFFNEEQQFELLREARRAGAKTIGYYVWELFDPSWTAACNSLYDAILAQTQACHDHFKGLGLSKLVRIPWGVDLGRFHPPSVRRSGGRLRFFHPAGWGGLHARRGTSYVIEAFRSIQRPGAELIIHTQHGRGVENHGSIQILHGNLPREQLIRLYQSADVAVLPSKWEGLGLTFLESLACGLPVVTVDAPPMNEFVRDGENGFVCRVHEWRSYPGIFVPGAHPDVHHLAECMARFFDRNVLGQMRTHARRSAETRYDWKTNSEAVVGLVHRLVTGSTAEPSLNLATPQAAEGPSPSVAGKDPDAPRIGLSEAQPLGHEE